MESQTLHAKIATDFVLQSFSSQHVGKCKVTRWLQETALASIDYNVQDSFDHLIIVLLGKTMCLCQAMHELGKEFVVVQVSWMQAEATTAANNIVGFEIKRNQHRSQYSLANGWSVSNGSLALVCVVLRCMEWHELNSKNRNRNRRVSF